MRLDNRGPRSSQRAVGYDDQTADASEPVLGSRLGRWRVVRKLASGGMATLFLAERRDDGGGRREAAIKVIHRHLADRDRYRAMFRDEARLSARIRHPAVVAVEEIGEADGTPFIVMEYVRGCALSELLARLQARGVRIPAALAVRLAIEIAEGLHAAHEARDEQGRPLEIVHRDVSPQNVLLDVDGRAKLGDFGIAKARRRLAATLSGGLVGKLRYMAPEQLRRGRGIDRRADVYSLGIVLWEMLAGRRIYPRGDFEVLERARDPRHGPPSAHAPGLPPELDAAVLAALAADPEHRPSSARAFASALAAALPAALSARTSDLADLVRQTADDEDPDTLEGAFVRTFVGDLDLDPDPDLAALVVDLDDIATEDDEEPPLFGALTAVDVDTATTPWLRRRPSPHATPTRPVRLPPGHPGEVTRRHSVLVPAIVAGLLALFVVNVMLVAEVLAGEPSAAAERVTEPARASMPAPRPVAAPEPEVARHGLAAASGGW